MARAIPLNTNSITFYELCPYRQRCSFNKWKPPKSYSGIVLLNVFAEAFEDLPRCRVPGQIDPPVMRVFRHQHVHHPDHFPCVLSWAIKVCDLVAAEFQAAVRIKFPFDRCHCGTTRCSPLGMRDRPPFILTAKGPNSSIEKNASLLERVDSMLRTRATFAA